MTKKIDRGSVIDIDPAAQLKLAKQVIEELTQLALEKDNKIKSLESQLAAYKEVARSMAKLL